MLNFIENYFFENSPSEKIFRIFRINLAFIVFLFCWLLFDPNFYLLLRNWLTVNNSFYIANHDLIWFKNFILITSLGMVFSTGVLNRIFTCLTSLFIIPLFATAASFSMIWNYNTHLIFFILALSFYDTASWLFPKKAPYYRALYWRFCQIYIGMIYIQAGLAKIVHGGWEWLFESYTFAYYFQTIGGKISHWSLQWPKLIRIMTIATPFYEIILGLSFFNKKTQIYGAIAGIAMHSSNYVLLNISYWHLWGLFPSLFFLTEWARYKNLFKKS